MSGFGDFGRELPRHQRGCRCGQCRQEGVNILEHQGFYAASFQKTVSGAALLERLSPLLKELADWVRAQSGIIGHIKAAVSGESQSVILSITKDIVRSQGNWKKSAAATVSFAAIVTGIDRAALLEKVEAIYQAL